MCSNALFPPNILLGHRIQRVFVPPTLIKLLLKRGRWMIPIGVVKSWSLEYVAFGGALTRLASFVAQTKM